MNTKPIPWTIVVGPEFITEQGGITLREWVLSPKERLLALEKTRRVFLRNFGLDPLSTGIGVPTPSYLTVTILGDAELVMPEDHNVMVKGYVLTSSKDVAKLSVPESIIKHIAMAPYIDQYRWLLDHVGDRKPVNLGE